MKLQQHSLKWPLIAIALSTFVLTAFKSSRTSLESAIQNKTVKVSISGDGNYTHYTKPIALELTNLTKANQEISVPLGSWFSSEDPGIQDIISTQEELIALKPGETKKVNIGGMCIQHMNAAPNDESKFVYHAKADKKLVDFAQYLKAHQYDGVNAQQLMWNVAENSDPAMNYTGTAMNLDAINYIRKSMNLPEYKPEEVAESPDARPKRKGTFKGMFEVEFSHAHKTHIALFNEQNIVLQEILPEQSIKGKKKVQYSFDPIAYEGQTLYARLIVDGQIEMERVIEL